MKFALFLQDLSQALGILTALCFFYHIIFLFVPFIFSRRKGNDPALRRYGVLIAARNEEAVIPHLLDSLKAQDYPPELIDIYVVADNCTDSTAQVASDHGATVFTRFNRQHIGKGYALNFLLKQIDRTAGLEKYDAFMVFDADNLVAPDYFRQIDQLPEQGYEAFCGYRNTKNFASNWITSGYALWYLHESTHLNRSRMALGSCCAVSGTGFGFTRQLLERLGGWDFHTLTEDLEFNHWCAVNGVKIGYCHDAIIYDEQPLTFGQSWKQRTRWAQGGCQVSIRYAGTVARGILRGNFSCFDFAMVSLWGFLLSFLTCFTGGLSMLLTAPPQDLLFSAAQMLVWGYGSMFLLGTLTTLMEWRRIHAPAARKIGALFTFPLFMMTFVPITLTSLFRKPRWEPIVHTVAISAKQLQEKV